MCRNKVYKGGKCLGCVGYFKSRDLLMVFYHKKAVVFVHYYLVELFVIYWQHLLQQRTPAFQWLYLLPGSTECCKLLNLDKAAFNYVTDSQLCISRYGFEI